MDRNRAQVHHVLADKTNEFAYKLDTLALKKTATNLSSMIQRKPLRSPCPPKNLKRKMTKNIASLNQKNVLTHSRIDVGKLQVKFEWIRVQWCK